MIDGIPVTSVSRTLFDLAGGLDEAAAGAGVERGGGAGADRSALAARSARRAIRGGVGRRCCERCSRSKDGRGGDHAQRVRGAVRRRCSTRTVCRGRDSTPTSAVRGRFFEVDCLWEREQADRRARRAGGARHRRARSRATASATGSCSLEGWRVDAGHLAPAARRTARRSPRTSRELLAAARRPPTL